ncbi:DUF3592 domain-containing protein [Kribbella sp. NPDC050470]|uniref:DUF3592 domain-containing protein n=1 Tax=unclassified Kribbella TaxID=2644121 RepID=UPI0037925499
MSGPGPFFFAIVATAGIVLGGITVNEFAAENELRSLLRARGQQTTGVVVSVLAESRTGEPLAAEVVLRDGRHTEVSFVSSNDDLELDPAAVGESVDLMIDPLSPDQNMVLDDFNADWDGSLGGIASRLIVPGAIAITGGVLGIRAYRLGRPWGGLAGASRRVRARLKSLAEAWDR